MAIFALLFVAAFTVFAVSAVAGGGAGLILLPLLGLALPGTQVPAALSIGTAASTLSRLALFRRSIRWDLVRWFVPLALPAAALGAWLLTRIAPLYLELLLGCFLTGNVLLLLGQRTHEPRHLGQFAWRSLGAVGGFISGFTGAIGVLLNGCYIRQGLTKEEIVATRAANEVLLHFVKLAVYAGFGLMTLEALTIGSLLAVAALLAPFGAARLLTMLSDASFRRMSQAAMSIAGIAMICTSASALAEVHQIAVRGHVRAQGLEAKLTWQDWSASFEWKRGRFPEFERTIAPEALPSHLRAIVASAQGDAERIICERVHRFGKSGFEVIIYKQGSRTKTEV